jgi:hypothetical protein
MTAYSLTGLAGTGMGTVKSEESRKDAGLFQQPMTGSDSSAAILLDLFGASRTINISGIYTTTDGTLTTFIAALDALVNGAQTQKTFVSGKSGATYYVLVTSVSWSAAEGDVSSVSYTIDMQQGSSA